MLGAALARGIVYPVPAAFNIRRNSLIVSAGADRRRRPRRLWRFSIAGRSIPSSCRCRERTGPCSIALRAAPKPAAAPNRPTVAHFGEGIVPPQADPIRLPARPLPPEKAGKMIILKGLLRADGLIDELEVYQGVSQEMDDNARLAFSQWKFKPALREGKPIPVQVLVGIPVNATCAANACSDSLNYTLALSGKPRSTVSTIVPKCATNFPWPAACSVTFSHIHTDIYCSNSLMRPNLRQFGTPRPRFWHPGCDL